MKKIAIWLALAASLIAPSAAYAQTCPAVAALPDSERRVAYAPAASTGPFSVTFALLGDGIDYGAWAEVWLNGVMLTPVTDWQLTIPAGTLSTACRPITNASITLTNAATGTLQIIGARRPRRTSQFPENAGVSARNLNQIITDLTAQNREVWDKTNDITGRVILAPPGEAMTILPTAANRAGKFITFDAGGNVGVTSPTPGLGNVLGPATSTVGHVATWANSSGTLLADGGASIVVGPATSTDNAIARFDGTTGTSIQNSTTTLSDTGAIAGATSLALGVALNPVVSRLQIKDLALPAGYMTFEDAQSTVSTVVHGITHTLAAVNAPGADSSAITAVARHFAAANGYPTSSNGANLRAGEFQVLRGTGAPAAATWGIEIGVHSQVAGVDESYNVGAFIRSGHTGWLSSGVRAGTAIRVDGEDGWTNLIHYVDTDNTTVLFNVDQTGAVTNTGNIISTLNTNAGLVHKVINVNTGTSATSGFVAANVNGNASFSIGGSGYTVIPLLQNRAYVFADAALSGIVIDNAGDDPIIFGRSNAEIARFPVAGTQTLNLGVTGTLTGSLGFSGATSGTAIITAQAAAGSPTLMIGTTSGTIAASATSPLAISATTGVITCTTCLTAASTAAFTSIYEAHVGYTAAIAQGITSFMNSFGHEPTETNANLTAPVAFTLSRMFCNNSSVGGAGQTVTYTLRKNGGDTTVVVSIASGATTGNDTTHSASFAIGDTYNIKAVNSATTGNITGGACTLLRTI